MRKLRYHFLDFFMGRWLSGQRQRSAKPYNRVFKSLSALGNRSAAITHMEVELKVPVNILVLHFFGTKSEDSNQAGVSIDTFTQT